MRAPLVLVPLGFVLCACSGSDAAPATPAARWHVDAGGPVDGDGTTWAQALPDLGAALAQARAGDEVWVAAGVYRPAPPAGPRDVAFVLGSGVSVYGGFAGDETDLAARDPVQHVTVLTGDLAGDDGPDFAGMTENSYQVVVAVDVVDALLDGFTICAGRADGPGFGATPASKDQGSGINLYHGSITVRGCRLTSNWASNHGAINDHSEGSIFDGCTFDGNHSAAFGAGLYLHHEAASLAIECTFTGNVAAAEGGGAYARSEHGARFEECTFTDNAATLGAGLYTSIDSSAHVMACTFERNIAALGGGGIYNDASYTMIEACTFLENEAATEKKGGDGGGGGSGGGGVWTNGGAVVAMDCTFIANRASFGGGFYAIHDARPLVMDCWFEANTANEAGGLYTLNSPTIVDGCTFLENEAQGGAFSVGGGVSNYFSDARVERCTFRGNRAELGGGGLYNEGEDPVVLTSRFEANYTTGPLGYGGAILDGYYTRARVEDCAFVGNSARQGGATFDLAFSEALIVNCTYVANSAEEGGGLFVGNLGTPRFTNCIVRDCLPDSIGGFGADFSYGLVQGGYPGLENMDADPLFERAPSPGLDGVWDGVDDDYGDLRLTAGSPCVDAGSNDAHSVDGLQDLGGAPRFVDDPATADTGAGTAPLVDRGCHEMQP